MNEMTIKRTTSKARTPPQECHGKECASGARNNYYLGKHLTPESYQHEQNYGLERRRLINRAVHGYGVVYGYRLSIEDPGGHAGELEIGSGLALDELGRELIQVYPVWLSLDDFLVLDAKGRLVRTDGPLNNRFDDDERNDDKRNDDKRGDDACGDRCWLLTAHYAEKTLGHHTISDPCRCDRDVWESICETVVYSLKSIDCEECCKPWKCDLHCCCPSESGCCAEHRRDQNEIAHKREDVALEYGERVAGLEDEDDREVVVIQKELNPRFEELSKEERAIERTQRYQHDSRGGCSCLCEHLTKLETSVGCDRTVNVDDCTTADLGNGVPLACLKLARDECGEWAIEAIFDACGPRPLVKRNDLLFDLINGCDLTRIVDIGWATWHRRTTPPVPFDDFLKALDCPPKIGSEDPSRYEEHATRDFWVEFSRPVRADTLTPDAFVMAVQGDYEDDFWRRYYRVPILSIETDLIPAEAGDPKDHVRSARFVVGKLWLKNALDADGIFSQGETRVEIEIRGDLIVDCLGQQVDANSHGRLAFPSGNGSPGGTYVSSFTVGRRVRASSTTPKQQPKQTPAPSRPRPQSNRVR